MFTRNKGIRVRLEVRGSPIVNDECVVMDKIPMQVSRTPPIQTFVTSDIVQRSLNVPTLVFGVGQRVWVRNSAGEKMAATIVQLSHTDPLQSKPDKYTLQLDSDGKTSTSEWTKLTSMSEEEITVADRTMQMAAYRKNYLAKKNPNPKSGVRGSGKSRGRPRKTEVKTTEKKNTQPKKRKRKDEAEECDDEIDGPPSDEECEDGSHNLMDTDDELEGEEYENDSDRDFINDNKDDLF